MNRNHKAVRVRQHAHKAWRSRAHDFLLSAFESVLNRREFTHLTVAGQVADKEVVDIGMGQINSIHLPELQRFGLSAEHLMDACKATYVSAWMLRRGFNRYGNSWFAAATYHSTTPVHNLRYQGLLKAELARQGVNLVVATAD